VQLKLARIVSVFEPAAYIYKRTKTRQCACHSSPQTIVEEKNNVLKILKNQANYSTKMGKSLYYEVSDDAKDTFCNFCNCKYAVTDTKYAPCQKVEVLSLDSTGGKRQTVSLSDNISDCWLIDPFIGMVEVGEVINLTAFYYMCPRQQIVN